METRKEIIIKNPKGEQKVVKRTTLEEANKIGLKKFGSGFGYSLEYCVYLGFRYQENFFEKADYFVIINEVINKNADLKKTKCLNDLCGMMVAFFHNPPKEEFL